MEIRELKYFLAIAREQSISKAAEFLYITQPSLSRQMQNLEKEIGKQLFIRGNKKITLTEAGRLLRKRAEELLDLYEKTTEELTSDHEDISGEIFIGGGESYTVSAVAKIANELQTQHPNIRFNFFSGDTANIMEKLDKGLIDFGILVEPADLTRYDYVRLPQKDTWGVLMRMDSPLAEKEFITPQDLYNVPIIRSKHTLSKNEVSDWFIKDPNQLNISATYNLIYNASLLVKEGMGYAITLDKLINTNDSELTFRPLKPKLESSLAFAWKRYQVFSKPAEIFLEKIKEAFTVLSNDLNS